MKIFFFKYKYLIIIILLDDTGQPIKNALRKKLSYKKKCNN